MKISNKYVEIQIEDGNPAVMIRFPLSNAQITLTFEEAKQLWASLDMLWGTPPLVQLGRSKND